MRLHKLSGNPFNHFVFPSIDDDILPAPVTIDESDLGFPVATLSPGRIVEMRGPTRVTEGSLLTLTCLVSPVVQQVLYDNRKMSFIYKYTLIGKCTLLYFVYCIFILRKARAKSEKYMLTLLTGEVYQDIVPA